MKPSSILVSVAGFVTVSLFSGNLYFVARMVDKIDKMEQTMWGLQQEVLVLKITFDNHNHKK